MVKAGVWLSLIIFILFIPNIFAQEGLTPEQRAYFDNQNQKIVAQIGTKIDQTSTQTNNNLKKEVDLAKNQIKDELVATIKSQMMGIVIGLSGIIIIVLSIFKILDYKIQATRNIKKYEDELKKQIDQQTVLIKENKQKISSLTSYRKSLVDYHNSLMAMQQGIPVSMSNINVPMFDVPKPQKKDFFKRLFNK